MSEQVMGVKRQKGVKARYRLSNQSNKKLSYHLEDRASDWPIHLIIMLLSSILAFLSYVTCGIFSKNTWQWMHASIACTVVWHVLSKEPSHTSA